MAKAKPTPKKKTAGRPPKNDPNGVDAIQNKIDLYFESLEKTNADGDTVTDEPTFCGLALALGYSSRTSLWENANAGNPISEPIKRSLLRIEESYEKGLRFQSCTGAIFALKNRGWTDKTEDKEKDETINRLLEIVTKITGQA
jgi:hypothetical protein